VNLEGTWLQKFEKELVGGKVVDGLNTYDLQQVNPKLKLNFNALWALSGWNAAANVRFVGGWHECYNNDCSDEGLAVAMEDGATAPIRDIDPYATLNLQVGKDFKSPIGRTSFSIGMINVFDADPPLLFSGGSLTASDAATYDYLGRFMYARLSQAF
jgi:iron complex outermembrane recepter protein